MDASFTLRHWAKKQESSQMASTKFAQICTSDNSISFLDLHTYFFIPQFPLWRYEDIDDTAQPLLPQAPTPVKQLRLRGNFSALFGSYTTWSSQSRSSLCKQGTKRIPRSLLQSWRNKKTSQHRTARLHNNNLTQSDYITNKSINQWMNECAFKWFLWIRWNALRLLDK